MSRHGAVCSQLASACVPSRRVGVILTKSEPELYLLCIASLMRLLSQLPLISLQLRNDDRTDISLRPALRSLRRK